MKLLLICPHFTPDLHAATGEVMTKLTQSLATRGYKVTVVTSLPWYKDHKVDSDWRGRPWRSESTPWGKVIRVWPFPSSKHSIVRRAFGFLGFTALSTLAGLFSGRHDVVMGMSPSIFTGEAAYLCAKRSKAPFVFNVQDIFPDIAIDLGALTNPGVIKAAKVYEKLLYKRSDAITVLSDDQANNIVSKLSHSDDSDKVQIIKNFVDIDKISPASKEGSYRRANNLSGKFVVMYSGNVGLSQSFDLIKAAAMKYIDDPNVVFVINGEGAARDKVALWAQNLHNVRLVNFGPREDLSDILGAADLHLILLKKGLAKNSTPSKLYGILASQRPVLASIDEGSEVANVIATADCGISVPPEDPKAFIDALDSLIGSSRADLDLMGKRGREYASNCMSPVSQAKAYDELFVSLTTK